MLIFLFRVCYKERVEGSRIPRGGRQTDGDGRRERMEERPLSALRPGDRATIGRLAGGGPIRRRLLELGLTPGTRITMVRLAPLRDPMEIRVRGYQLCVRRSEADAVWVEVEPALSQTPPAAPGHSVSRVPAPAGVLRGASSAFASLRAFCFR
jgi:ferrous iron transport protein A